jgi:hypothetical protein
MATTAQKIFDRNITVATSIVAVDFGDMPSYVKGLTLEAIFTSGTGGTSTKAYVQTTIDGTNWTDIACFAFTTTDARRIFNLTANTPITSIATPTDGSLSDNTAVDGIIGTQVRVKYVTVGTYAAANLKIFAKYNA